MESTLKAIDPRFTISGDCVYWENPNLYCYGVFDWAKQKAWCGVAFRTDSDCLELTALAFPKDSQDYKDVEEDVEISNRNLRTVENRYFAILPFTQEALEKWEEECKAKGEPRAA